MAENLLKCLPDLTELDRQAIAFAVRRCGKLNENFTQSIRLYYGSISRRYSIAIAARCPYGAQPRAPGATRPAAVFLSIFASYSEEGKTSPRAPAGAYFSPSVANAAKRIL